MGYTQEQLDDLWTAYFNLQPRCDELVQRCVTKPFKTYKSREYATHGLSRRLGILMHCIERVFTRLPPETKEPPVSGDRLDATVYLQAFVFNVFGCVDNLAHVWVNERNVRDRGGRSLRDRAVGFRKSNEIVRESLTPALLEHLTHLDNWFVHLENMRHALAHRIPLYIPPYYVPDDKLNEYYAMDERIHEARKRRDYDELEKLKNQQGALTRFEPITTHSFSENSPAVFLHSQMIMDYNVVGELASRVLKELDL